MTCHFDGEQLKIYKLYIAMYMRRSPIIQQTLIVIIDAARLGEGPWCLPGYCSLGPSKLIQIFINCLDGVSFHGTPFITENGGVSCKTSLWYS